jgi:hypothetical protein
VDRSGGHLHHRRLDVQPPGNRIRPARLPRGPPDSGGGLSYENQNDDQGHESGIPAGNWRFLVARLECTQPNEGNRCVGAAKGAHTYVKQVRIQLTDVVSPTISIGGSMFSGAELRGPQTISVSAADQGAGLQSVQVVVNGQGATGDDLSGSCNPLPGNMTSRLSPCPPSFGKTYTLDTAKAPFREGANSITVCAYDYAQPECSYWCLLLMPLSFSSARSSASRWGRACRVAINNVKNNKNNAWPIHARTVRPCPLKIPHTIQIG